MRVCVHLYKSGQKIELCYSPGFSPWNDSGKKPLKSVGKASTGKPLHYKAWVLINHIFFPSVTKLFKDWAFFFFFFHPLHTYELRACLLK